MQNNTSLRLLTRLAPLSAAALLLASGCGSTTTSHSTAQPADTAVSADDVEREANTPSTGAPVDSIPDTSGPTTATTAPTTTTPNSPVTCGDFGPIPPLPDSMPTKQFDTDGDGTHDDEVTAYGSEQGWALRVVENGVTSEALMPSITGWAYISAHSEVNGRAVIEVTDNDEKTTYTFGTANGCVELLNTFEPIDGLTSVPSVPRPTLTLPPVLDSPASTPPPCGTFGAIPAGSTMTSDLSVALDADGVADDQAITYTDGIDKLRTVRNGVISEFEVPDVGVSHIRALGVGNAAEISTGNEVFVRTRGGASGAVVGVFGHDADGCLFEFTRFGAALEMYIGTTIGNSSGAYCADGILAEWVYTQDTDGTYAGSSAAYFESTAGNFTSLPASDDFSEGLDAADLSPAELDCFGFGL